MIGVLVPDSSLIAKLFLQEPQSMAVEQLLDGAGIVAAPHLLTLEVASAITRRFRTGGVDRYTAEQALGEARAFFAGAGIALVPDAQLLPRAEQIALDLKHALKDCVFIALAEREKGLLVTSDAALLSRALPLFPFVKPL